MNRTLLFLLLLALGLVWSLGSQKHSSICTVNGVYDYQGESYHKIKVTEKLVAIDLKLHLPRGSIDLDDIEINDGKSGKCFGSFPDIRLLDERGQALPELPVTLPGQYQKPPTKNDLRLLLVYAIPRSTKSVTLSYQGHPLTAGLLKLGGDPAMYVLSLIFVAMATWVLVTGIHPRWSASARWKGVMPRSALASCLFGVGTMLIGVFVSWPEWHRTWGRPKEVESTLGDIALGLIIVAVSIDLVRYLRRKEVAVPTEET